LGYDLLKGFPNGYHRRCRAAPGTGEFVNLGDSFPSRADGLRWIATEEKRNQVARV